MKELQNLIINIFKFDESELNSLKEENIINNPIDDKEQLEVRYSFKFKTFNFEFYLYSDQLEYYILKNSKIIHECIIEDYYDVDTMFKQFKEHLIDDLKKEKLI